MKTRSFAPRDQSRVAFDRPYRLPMHPIAPRGVRGVIQIPHSTVPSIGENIHYDEYERKGRIMRVGVGSWMSGGWMRAAHLRDQLAGCRRHGSTFGSYGETETPPLMCSWANPGTRPWRVPCRKHEPVLLQGRLRVVGELHRNSLPQASVGIDVGCKAYQVGIAHPVGVVPPTFERVFVDHVLVRLGVPLLVIDVTAERLEERIEELPPKLCPIALAR